MRKLFWSLHFPRKTYAEGVEYYGTFPEGFIKNMKRDFPEIWQSPVVEMCSGMSEVGDIRVDINPKSRATLICDARDTGLNSDFAGLVILDPYYSPADFEKVGQTYVSVYDFIREAARITRPGGFIAVLHNKPPRKPKGFVLHGIVAISMGPDRNLRMLQIWQKEGGQTVQKGL